MFKLVLIGVLLLGVLGFVMWNFWRMVLLKHKYYTQSQRSLCWIAQFKDVPQQQDKIKEEKRKLWILAVSVTLGVAMISSAYFLVSRFVFIRNHDHVYKDRVIAEPICITEGTLQYKCRYCDDGYEEPIPTVEHNYSETNRQDSTCAQEGFVEYTCEMCSDIKKDPIGMKEHRYSETNRQESTCIQEGFVESTCEVCASVKTDPLGLVDHQYTETNRQNSTCIQEGFVEYTCEMCADVKSEALQLVEHRYTETNRQNSTCIAEGFVEYTCEMCADVKTEALSLIEHRYTETVEQAATCIAEGILARKCEHCDSMTTESIPVTDDHNFRVFSYTQTSFWKNGYQHYRCQDCGEMEYSLRAETINWIAVLAVVVLLIAVIVIIGVRVDEYDWEDTFGRPAFWVSLLFAVASLVFVIIHWGVIIPHQNRNQPIGVKWSGAPVDCQLVEIERVASSYTQNGTVTYQCEKCDKEYTEYLELKAVDPENISLYTEPVIADVTESEKNNKISKASEIPLSMLMTGHLSSTKDVDFYKVTLPDDGDLKFRFTHHGNEYSYHWDVAIYDTDQSTVLNEGYIDKEEFGVSDLPAGTYYLKISPISGGNPISNYYSDAQYHIQFIPECTNHSKVSQSFAEVPSCTKETEVKTVCHHCGMVISVEYLPRMEHKWSEWEVVEPASAISVGEKTRTCLLCEETEADIDWPDWLPWD